MSIIIRHSIKEPIIYSITGMKKDVSISNLRNEYVKESKKVITLESEQSLEVNQLIDLFPEIIICNDFKPSKSFIKKLKRK